MPKNIVELISSGQSIHAVKNVERTLANKLLQAISEQANEVARQAYGTLDEYFGGDEQPDYVNNSDNAYAVFFANALKKFGVNGPEDFKDEVTKQRFFDYVDHNWRAQDSVQTPIQGGNMELGTQTALPSPATPPMAPTAPTGGSPTTAQGNDPSLATMAPAGPSIDKTAPLDQSGQDPTLNGVQNQQTYAGNPAGGDQYGGDPLAADDGMGGEGGELDGSGSFGNMGGMNQGMGAGNGDMCPMCKGTGKAACPTCGRPHSMDDAQSGLDQDPDLEIGPEDDGSGMDSDDEDGMQADGFGGDDELTGNSEGLEGGDEGGAFGDEGDQAGNGDASIGGDEQETDDPFDDEDAYTIDASDFNNAGGDGEDEDTDEEGADEFGEGGFEGQDDGGDEGDEGFNTGDPDADIDNEKSEEGEDPDDAATGAGQEADLQGDDQDPDLEIGDDDSADEDDDADDEDYDDSDEDEDNEDADVEDDSDQDDIPPKKTFGEALKHRSWSRKERKADSKKPNRQAAKKEIRMAEDFGFGLDDAEDDVFIAEALMMQQKAPAPDPGLGKLINYVQQQLSRIKKMRNTMLMQLRRERAVIKKDPAIDGQEKMDAMKQLAQMATDNRKFFKNQAKLVKAMFTGNLSGGGMGDEEGGMDQDTDQDQEQGGFPPVEGQDLKIRDDEGTDQGDEGDQDFGDDVDDQSGFEGGDEGGDEEVEPNEDDDEEMSQGTAPSAPAGFPAKKKSPFPPKKNKGGDKDEDAGNDDDDDDSGDEDVAPAKPAKKPFPPVKEEELNEYGNMAALESKIKMLAMQIATKGDPGGKRRAALNSLEHQLKVRK